MRTVVGLIALLAAVSGFAINDSFAQVSPNNTFVLEGSGFAVTEETIEITELDLALSTQQQSGSSIRSVVEDGFVILGDEDFIATDLTASLLREGKYIRINGQVESSTGEEASVGFFGRLIEESQDASVYGFTGRITVSDQTYKIIYTTKLSKLVNVAGTTSGSTEPEQPTIRILEGSSTQGGTTSSGYFSIDRISVEPGTSATIVNDDVVSHRIVSGTGLGTHSNVLTGKICSEVQTNIPKGFSFTPTGSDARGCDFIFDGRINTGAIAPGESVTVSFNDQGFYRLINPDYPWMRIDGYVFANLDNPIFGQDGNQRN